MNVVNQYLPAISNSQFCIIIFLDFTMAFDCVSYEILINKFYRYGLRASVSDFFKYYLSGRTQSVAFENNVISPTLPSTIGVPQGTPIAPFFYIAYANNLFNNIDVNMTMYADDTVIRLTDSCPDRIITKLNDVMELISSWCDLNLIGINVFKSKAMAVSNRLITSDLHLKLNSIPLEFVKNFTYLGIKLDSKLKYSEHIEFLKTKLAQLTGIARRVTGYFDLHSAYLYYFSFVYS